MRNFLNGLVIGIILPFAAALSGALLGYFRIDAKPAPPPWEVALAGRAVEASVGRQAPRVTNPIAPTEVSLIEGMKMYREMCAGCHGDPNGESGFGAGFYPRVPQFAPHPPRRPEWQLFWIVKYGVRYTGMPSWEGLLGKTGDEAIWKVVTFLSRLDSLPPAVNAEWHKKPAQ